MEVINRWKTTVELRKTGLQLIGIDSSIGGKKGKDIRNKEAIIRETKTEK